VTPSCPADAKSTAVCRPSAGDCDVPESCDGVNDDCPADAFAPSSTVCRPDAGDCDVAETCIGSSAICPADAKSTSECRAAVGVCDVAEVCDGVSDDCPPAALQPDGTVCDDSDGCTTDDICTAGICGGVPSVVCPACEACEPLFGSCVPTPEVDCREPFVPFKARLLLKDNDDDAKDKLLWKWLKGERTEFGDFGDPVNTDDYTLCVYESSGGSPSVLLRATVPAGGQCAGRACWKGVGRNPAGSRGYKYKDKERTPDGLEKLALKPGEDVKAKVTAKGRGANLSLPSPLDVELPVSVQLQAANGECWAATYFAAGVQRNDARVFSAKAGSPSGAFLDATSGVLD
jgi:hypothetical protein